MNTPRSLALAALVLLSLGAQAQVAGTYTGTTSQGLPIEITLVQTDSDGLVFTGNTTQWTESCRSGDSKSAWWGVGAYTPVTSNSLTAEFRGQSLYEKLSMSFDASGTTVTGTFKGGEATYVDVNANTRATEPCNSGLLSFSATLQPALKAPFHALPAAGLVRNHPAGR